MAKSLSFIPIALLSIAVIFLSLTCLMLNKQVIQLQQLNIANTDLLKVVREDQEIMNKIIRLHQISINAHNRTLERHEEAINNKPLR